MTKAANLRELLAQTERKTAQIIKCATCLWLMTLGPDDADAFTEALQSGEWHMTVLAETLKPMGLDVTPGALNHHFRQQHKIPTR